MNRRIISGYLNYYIQHFDSLIHSAIRLRGGARKDYDELYAIAIEELLYCLSHFDRRGDSFLKSFTFGRIVGILSHHDAWINRLPYSPIHNYSAQYTESPENKILVEELLDMLDGTSRRIVVDHYMNDISFTDISRQTGISYGIVWRKGQKAIRDLKRMVLCG